MFLIIFPLGVFAQDDSSDVDSLWKSLPPAVDAPGAVDEEEVDTLPASSEVLGTVKANSAKLNKIGAEENGIYKIPDASLKKGDYILFVRPSQDTFEILARGTVIGRTERVALVELVSDSVTKLPRADDGYVKINSPWVRKPGEDEKLKENPIGGQPAEEPTEPGHIEIDYGLANGSLSSAGSTEANAYKNSSFQFKYLRVEWYLDFLWQFGLEFEDYSGNYPTSTYYRVSGNSTQDANEFSVKYRLPKMEKVWNTRLEFRVISAGDVFTTVNPDQALISSTYTYQGLGVRYDKEFAPHLWIPQKAIGFKPYRLVLDLNYFPSVTAKDGFVISRGTSGSGSATEVRLGAEAFLYLKFIPIFKRFMLRALYVNHKFNLNFSGPTISENAAGAYTIPEGGTYNETTSYFLLTIGLRWDDYIGLFLKPK